MSKFFTDGFGSGVVSGGLGLISNIINNAQQRKAEQRQFNYQKELMGIQNQQQIDFWKMNNEYNSPANQKKLVEEAGLNPDFYFGQGGAFTPAQMANAAQGAAPETGYSPIEGERMYLNAVQSANWRANTQNAMADAHLKEEMAHSEEVKRSLMTTERILNEARKRGIDLDNKLMEDTFENQVKESLARLNKLESETAYNERHTKYLDFQEQMANMQFQENVRMNNAKISEIVANNELSRANKARVLVQTAYDMAVNKYFKEHEKLPSSSTLNELLMDILQQLAPPGTLSWSETKKAMAEVLKTSRRQALKEKFPIEK